MLPKKIYHYSSKEIERLNPYYYDEDHYEIIKNIILEVGNKPIGLWVSIEDYKDDMTWKSWCIDEQFNVDGLKYRYKVLLPSNANILWLKSFQDITDFTKEYQKPREFYYSTKINWNNVSEKYDGIFIAPYQWNARLDNFNCWYYGWDCASGCIWNLHKVKIKSVK